MAGSLEANKVVAAVLTAGIIVVGVGVVADLLYHPETVAENAFPITVEGATEVAEAVDEPAPIPLPVLLANASAEAGAGAFRACAACHTVDEGGASRVGPNLWNIVGRDIAGYGGFRYSDALTGRDGEWTFEYLYEFIKAPRDWAPGTSMSYAGLRGSEDRADVIAYLRSLSDNPAPLPEVETVDEAAEVEADAAAAPEAEPDPEAATGG